MTNWKNQTFETRGADGEPNGHIIRVWESDVEFAGYRPKQVYVTTLAPGATKGPHLHMRRDSLFCCIAGGCVLIRVGVPGSEAIQTFASGEGHGPRAVHVPAGTPATLVNIGEETAYVINISSGHYDPNDEHEVQNYGNV